MIVATGKGTVFARPTIAYDTMSERFVFQDSNEIHAIESDLIAVTNSGVVFFEHDGRIRMVQSAEVSFTAMENNPFGLEPDAQPQPSCAVCGDDNTRVKNMVPPACPKCGRGTK